MIRLGMLTALAGSLMLAPGARAQAPTWRFQWKSGEVLTYRVEEVIHVIEEVDGTKVEATTKIGMTKKWQILGVDPAGVATMQLSLTTLRQETAFSDETLVFDSDKPDQSNPQLRDQLSQWVGQALAVLRVDARGQVIEVKESKQGKGARYESEPPFVLILPADGAKTAGQTWERSYRMTLEPPQGTGEQYPAGQKYTCKAAEAKAATIGLVTAVESLPPAVADRLPLLPLQLEGEIVFDPMAGSLRSAHLSVDKELKGHQGEKSSYRFIRTYREERIGN